MCDICASGDTPVRYKYVNVAQVTNNRAHRKKRLHKKWGKRYGYNTKMVLAKIKVES